MTDYKALIAEARFGGHTAREVAELLDALASAADRCDANSYSEIASISRRGSAAIRRLAEALEDATPPEGWRVTEYERHGSRAGVFEVLDGGDVSWCADGVCDADGMCLHFDTARAAMEALGKGDD